MNTPKFLITLFFSIFLFSACSDDDDNSINSNSLPNTATAFIEQVLPGYKILKVEDLKPKEGDINKYKVSLDKDLIVVFTEMGICVEAENETKLPESLINYLLADEIAALKIKYPTLEIKQILNNSWGGDFYQDVVNRKKVVLADNTEVLLYTYLGINKTNIGVDVKNSQSETSAKIKKFVDEYYTNVQVGLLLHAVESDGREVYKAYLTPSGTVQVRTSDRLPDFSGLLVFDSNGEWTEIRHIASYPISEKIFGALITDYAKKAFESRYPNTSFYEISKHDDSYTIRLSNILSTVISYEAAPVFQLDVIVDFINTHFGSSTNGREYSSEFKPSGYNKKYYTTVILDASKLQVVKMESFADGVWLSLETENIFIPQTIVQTLPTEIKIKLENDGLLDSVTKITRAADGSSFVVKAGNKEYVYPKAS